MEGNGIQGGEGLVKEGYKGSDLQRETAPEGWKLIKEERTQSIASDEMYIKSKVRGKLFFFVEGGGGGEEMIINCFHSSKNKRLREAERWFTKVMIGERIWSEKVQFEGKHSHSMTSRELLSFQKISSTLKVIFIDGSFRAKQGERENAFKRANVDILQGHSDCLACFENLFQRIESIYIKINFPSNWGNYPDKHTNFHSWSVERKRNLRKRQPTSNGIEAKLVKLSSAMGGEVFAIRDFE